MDQGPIPALAGLFDIPAQKFVRREAMLGPGEIFTLFFITLGPLKVLGPFAHQTHGLSPAAVRGIAIRAFVLSVIAVVVGGVLGRTLAINWQISMPALLISTGVIFFLVALQVVMEQYEAPKEPVPSTLPPDPMAAAIKIAFPTVVTPYGIAAVIALLAATRLSISPMVIWSALSVVMVLNLIAMLSAHAVMHGWFVLAMRVLGAVLGVLQVALAVQIVLVGLSKLNLVPTT